MRLDLSECLILLSTLHFFSFPYCISLSLFLSLSLFWKLTPNNSLSSTNWISGCIPDRYQLPSVCSLYHAQSLLEQSPRKNTWFGSPSPSHLPAPGVMEAFSGCSEVACEMSNRVALSVPGGLTWWAAWHPGAFTCKGSQIKSHAWLRLNLENQEEAVLKITRCFTHMHSLCGNS